MPLAAGTSAPKMYELFSEVVVYADYYPAVQSVSAYEHDAVGHVNLSRDPNLGMSSVLCDPIPLNKLL